MGRTLMASGLVLAAGVWLLYEATLGFRALTQETARRVAVRDQPRPLPAMTLQLQDGRRAELAELRGRPVVATFMYTRCHGVCPIVAARMSELRTRLRAAAGAGDVHFLSLSFDPRADTPERLAGFAGNFGASIDNWWVARPQSDLEPILRFFDVTVIPAGNGMFVHNAAFYLIDRELRLVDILDADKPEAVQAALEERL